VIIKLSTTFPLKKPMTDTTFTVRLTQLIEQVNNHPNRDELIKLMEEQLLDDAE
jgi:hypothetical protein